MIPAIILPVCLAFVLIRTFNIQLRYNLPKKPFGCLPCLSGWLSLPLIVYSQQPIIFWPYMMAASMLTAVYLNEKLLR